MLIEPVVVYDSSTTFQSIIRFYDYCLCPLPFDGDNAVAITQGILGIYNPNKKSTQLTYYNMQIATVTNMSIRDGFVYGNIHIPTTHKDIAVYPIDYLRGGYFMEVNIPSNWSVPTMVIPTPNHAW